MSRQIFTTAISFVFLTLTSLHVGAQPTPTTADRVNKSIRVNKEFVNVDARKAMPKLCKVCAEWGPGEPGQLFGPCVRYEFQPCATPPK